MLSPDKSTTEIRVLKYVSLVTLTVQNAALGLSMRYARTRTGDMFVSSSAVFMSEFVKLLSSLALVWHEEGSNFKRLLSVVHSTVILQPLDTLKVCVPSFIYVLQNNLLYVAASHLDAATYQVTYQLKILTTALFSMIILGRRLLIVQWTALVFLLAGVVMVQLAQTDEGDDGQKKEVQPDQNRLIGFLAAIAACFLSGFAGIYFEKILKGSDISVWMRNVQLSICSLPFAFMTCVASDWHVLHTKGFFYGYDLFIVYLVVLQACGGLLVAMVVKYADNILKGFATSLAIVLSCAFSVYFFKFHINGPFAFGTLLVIISIFMYGYQPSSTSAVTPSKSGMTIRV